MAPSDPLATTPAVATARTAGQVTFPSAVLLALDAYNVTHLTAAQTTATLALATITTAAVQKWWEQRRGHALGQGS